MDQIDEKIFIRLEQETRARYNWRKVLTMIQLVKALSPREAANLKKKDKDEGEVEVKYKFWDFKWADKYL